VLGQEVARSFSTEAQGRHVSVRVDAPADLPLISVDPLRIREVLANLVSNALHHTPPGGVVTVAADMLNERMVVTVEDSGSGIAPEDLPRIFDRLYKGRSSRGHGLGLTIARNLVTAHGGAIRAESPPGGGATVTFTVPFDSPSK
jgi:two-component system sensor histidine kinase BaeS